jgi:hypothetical protein
VCASLAIGSDKRLARVLALLKRKTVEMPQRKHDNSPLLAQEIAISACIVLSYGCRGNGSRMRSFSGYLVGHVMTLFGYLGAIVTLVGVVRHWEFHALKHSAECL